jgi:hypothetical protein
MASCRRARPSRLPRSAFADLVYRDPATVGPIGGAAASFAVIAPDFLFKAGDGRRQLQVYVVDRSGGSPRLQPVTLPGA